MKPCLVDVNLLVAAIHDRHAWFRVAREWFQVRQSREVRLCRAVQLSLLRLSTNRHVTGGTVPTASEAWTALERVEADPRVEFQPEPAGVMAVMKEWTSGTHLSGSGWTDAYLAAFAHQAGLRIATMDRGVERFPVEVELVG
jgi:toxin-antitoxin system PIN domain toxin